MGSRAKPDRSSKGKGVKYELINFDNRNEANPLKQEVAVRRAGGIFLSPNGVKVEIPPGASTGRRERLLCTPVPTTACGLLCPWLGPNLRMASEMQFIYAPQNFRLPVGIIIPFTYASAREMAYPLEDESGSTDKSRMKLEVSKKEGVDGDSTLHSDASSMRNLHSADKEGNETTNPPTSQSKGLPNRDILDTRSVFLLTCKLGEDKWEVVSDFKVIQPVMHHSSWPIEIKRLVVQSSRWPDLSYLESSPMSDSQPGSKRMSGTLVRGRRTATAPMRETEPLEFIRSIENYCGGVYLRADELCHCFLLVLGTKAEKFVINRDGGLYRSPLLHPHLRVRIPKRSCLEDKTACFKVLDIRPNWAQAAVNFDSQMAEVEGCSDIYELDLQKVVLRRPATVRIPLPHWFIERQNRIHENLEQISVTAGSSEPQDAPTTGGKFLVDGAYIPEKPLLLLYQSTTSKRQIVWQIASAEDAREDSGRRKSRFQVSRKEIIGHSRCKLDNLYTRLGWSHLTVGVRGGQWYTIKKPVYFTKRTAFFETNILGRFVLIGARDPERTPANKLAHLMTRVEALTAAPPGALVLFLQLQPNCWRVMADIYPEERLSDNIQEHVAAGWIPIVQVAGGLTRRTMSLCNALLQTAELIQLPKELADLRKSRKSPPIRFTGADINHVLMFGGLCLEFRFTGDVRMKPVSQFEAMSQVFKGIKSPEPDLPSSPTSGQGTEGRNLSLNVLGVKQQPISFNRNVPSMLLSTACLQHHELMHETGCMVEIEPMQSEENKYIRKSMEKTQMISELLCKGIRDRQNTVDEVEEEEEEEDATYSDEDTRHRSSSNETESAVPYEGDDGEMDELGKDTREQAAKNQPLSVAAVNAELLRRLNNVLEKSRMSRAANFLQRVHDIYHVGTVQVWLVPPQGLSQLAACKDINKENPMKNTKVHSNQSESGRSSSRSDSPVRSVSRASERPVEHSNHQDAISDEGGHNAIRWNPVELTHGPDGKSSMMPDLLAVPEKPLAVYNLLIDPDLAVSYLRNSGAGSAVASVTQKRSNKEKGGSVRGKPKGAKQRNVSATTGMKITPTTTVSSTYAATPLHDHKQEIVQEELNMFTESNLVSLASLIKEPHKFGEALGLSPADIDKAAKEHKSGSMGVAYGMLSMWKTFHTIGSRQVELEKDEVPRNLESSSERSKGSPVEDLIDVFQSLGYFEAVEFVKEMKYSSTRDQTTH